ncbi:hypothetical protein [Nitrosospira sp. NRS527]|uniref:hypothetical protein n=1 Tax=Nitrosospira sp. NRS527 TaxID=155925 RepID=UPI001BCC0E0D|nr:hypothetical protein [Nitrosospira sp. NRS527]
MSDRPFIKPGVVTNKIRTVSNFIGNVVEQSKKSTPGDSMATDASESVEREQRKSHHVISTAAYYEVEGHEPDGYVYDEAQDWLEADAETGRVLYVEKDF